MSIVNQIASFGKGGARGEGSGLAYGNQAAKLRADNQYRNKMMEIEQQRLDQSNALAAEREERQYGAGWAKAYFSAPEDKRGLILRGGAQDAIGRGYISPDEAAGLDESYMYRLAAASGLDFAQKDGKSPSSVEEWKYYNSLPPEQQSRYLTMKRADKTLNLGGTQEIVNPTGGIKESYKVTPKPQDMPEFKAAQEQAVLEAQAKIKPYMERDIAEQKASGKARGESVAGLPRVEATSKAAINAIDMAMKHPGLKDAVGFSSVLNPVATPGSKRKNFLVLLDQIKGKVFLEAYQSLKGGGQITEVEGKKAQEALARLNTAQSEEEFVSALGELKSVISTGLGMAKSQAGQPSESGIANEVNWSDL